MEQVGKRSNKSIDEYRHNIKLLKYHLKKEQKMNQTLRYKQSKNNKKQSLTINKQSRLAQRHHLYAMLGTVSSLTSKIKEMGLSLGDLFRMADSSYRGEITRQQFMTVVSRIRANLEQNQINEMFYAIDSNLNGMLSSDEYDEFLNAHGGTENKSALKFQKESAEKFIALLKKKNLKTEDLVKKMLDPIPLEDMNAELKKLGLNGNQIMTLLKMWDPSLTGLIKHQTFLKSMEGVKQKDQRQIQNEKYEKGIKELCVLFRDKKINPIQIFQLSDTDGKNGVSPFELEQGFSKLIPDETPYQIKKWVSLINVNNDAQISREQFISAIRSFYSIQKIDQFSNQYQKLHPQLKKVLAEQQIPAEKILNQLSIYIEDNGLTKTQVFHRIDISHNGLLDKSELCAGLQNVLGMKIGEVGKVLTVFDRDSSGEISLGEWLSILGEDVEMEDVEIPKEKNKGENQAQKNQKEKKKVDKEKQPKSKEKQIVKKQEQQSPPKKEQKKQVKPKQPTKINEINKKPSAEQKPQKNNNKEESPNPKPPPKKNEEAKKKEETNPLKDQDKNKVPIKKEVDKPIKQSVKKQEKPIIRPKKKEPQPFKKFEDEQVQEIKQALSQDEINTEPIERQIAENYAKTPKRIKDIFNRCSKNSKKGLSQRQLGQFIRELKLKAECDDKAVRKIFEDNCSNNGLMTTEWLQKLMQNFQLTPKEEVEEIQVAKDKKQNKEQEKNGGNKGKIQQDMIILNNDIIKSKIPKILEEKVDHYDDDFDLPEEENHNNIKKQKQVIPTKKDVEEIRGKNHEEFQQLIANHILKPQTFSDEGYKLKKFISCQDELKLLQTKYQVTAASLKKNKKLYQDKSFPPSLSSLTHIEAQSQIPKVTLMTWKHYREFYKKPELFKDSISPNDIKQGLLGDCYFLCSLAALAEYKNVIERLFEYYDIDNGYFLVWICVNGSWKLIQLDGYFPMHAERTSQPAFSHGVDEELWVMLLQKAYAKVYGSYQKIDGGKSFEAIINLTGASGKQFVHTDPALKIDDLWNKLISANKQRFIMTCGTEKKKEIQSKQKDHSEGINKEGLVQGHAYSILDIREYKGQRLIQLRNPWGNKEWNGEWSDSSKKWTEHAKKQLNYTTFADDGIFWMPFEAYFQKYLTTSINYLRPNYHYISKLHKAAKSLVVSIPEGSLHHGFVTISQKDHRYDGIPNTPYSLINVISLEYKQGKLTREISNERHRYQRDVSAEITASDHSQITVLIILDQKTDINICTYADQSFEFSVQQDLEKMLKCAEDLALLESKANNAQDVPNMFRFWNTSVGEFSFITYKSIAKKNIKFQIEFTGLINIQLIPSNNKVNIQLAPGEAKTIKGKITNMQKYNFGPMNFSQPN